jgi:hypothetical protein
VINLWMTFLLTHLPKSSMKFLFSTGQSAPGALGKPFWLLNRYNTCWRWLLDREDSPWYPTTRLFRQDATREWVPAIARITAALQDYVRNF